MRLTFSYLLLITWFLTNISCKTQFIHHSVQTHNFTVSDSLAPLDSAVVQQYLPYREILEKDMKRVITITSEEMVKDKPESPLTNFLADLVWKSAREAGKGGEVNPEKMISFLNYGGIRTFLPKGEITVGKIFELMPFENELVLVKLDGSQIKQFLDVLASKGGDSVGGVSFVISGETSKNIKIGGKDFLENEKYWVATSDYIASGGDGLGLFLQHSGYISTGKKIRDILISEMENIHKKGEIVNVVTDGRIRYE